MATRTPVNSPVEGQVVDPSFFCHGGWMHHIQTMVGKGISEPSIRFVPMSQVVFSGLELAQNIVGNKVGGMFVHRSML